MLRVLLLVAFVALASAAHLLGCGGSADPPARDPEDGSADGRKTTAETPREESLSPSARPDIVESFRARRAETEHTSDGGGLAWLVDEEGGTLEAGTARAGASGRWTVVYEAGPAGVAEGGTIVFQVPPFWGWDTPQTAAEAAPGYTTVETEAEGVALGTQSFGRDPRLAIRIEGRALAEGERVRIAYGAGPAGARADRYAERESRFWIAVDGDGDGVPVFLTDSPVVHVLPGRAAALQLTAPSVVRPSDAARLVIAVLDGRANTGCEVAGRFELDELPDGASWDGPVELEPADGGRASAEIRFEDPGLYRLAGTFTIAGEGGGERTLAAVTNPIDVSERAPRILWGDLHGHSNLSDGTGTPEDYFVYARDVAALDVIALTDHDHWGVLFLDEHPEMWQRIQDATRAFHEPGRFVTLPGYEWTSWLHGHRHVLRFDDAEGEVLSSIDERYETPAQLWDALRGEEVLTFAHHSAGGPVATNWDYVPDPEIEPVTEIVSVHGSSEAADSPFPIYAPVPGNFVRDVLDRGVRYGFLGSGDSHDGHPGFAHLVTTNAGVAAILSEENTREAVLEALRDRRCYATTGERIVLRAGLGGHRMGSTIAVAPEGETLELFVQAIGTDALREIDVVRRGEEVLRLDCEGEREIAISLTIEDLRPDDYLYVRVVQEGKGAAWSSPFFFDAAPPGAAGEGGDEG